MCVHRSHYISIYLHAYSYTLYTYHTCTDMCVHTLHIYTCIHVHMLHIYTHTSAYITHLHTHICIHNIFVHAFEFLHKYICTYIHMYIHVCTHMTPVENIVTHYSGEHLLFLTCRRKSKSIYYRFIIGQFMACP